MFGESRSWPRIPSGLAAQPSHRAEKESIVGKNWPAASSRVRRPVVGETRTSQPPRSSRGRDGGAVRNVGFPSVRERTKRPDAFTGNRAAGLVAEETALSTTAAGPRREGVSCVLVRFDSSLEFSFSSRVRHVQVEGPTHY